MYALNTHTTNININTICKINKHIVEEGFCVNLNEAS